MHIQTQSLHIINSLDVGWLRVTNRNYSLQVWKILLAGLFSLWEGELSGQLMMTLTFWFPKILVYVLQLKFSISSIRVALATISICHIPVLSCSVFSHLTVSKFFKGWNHTDHQLGSPSPLRSQHYPCRSQVPTFETFSLNIILTTLLSK